MDEKFVEALEKLLEINLKMHLLHAKRLKELEDYLESETTAREGCK
mgnify:CR=1 FL=1